MASGSATQAAEKRQRMLNQVKRAQNSEIGISQRRSLRIANNIQKSTYSTKQENFLNPQQILNRAGKRIQDPENHSSTERPRKRLQTGELPQTTSDSLPQTENRKRPRENEVPPSHASPEPPSKRVRTSAASVDELSGREAIRETRVGYWVSNSAWPTEEQEKTMNRFRDLVDHALARKKSSSLRRKRSDASIHAETISTRTPSEQQPREQKSAPYRHPRYEGQLQERGSFMDNYKEGITAHSRNLCQKLLKTPREPPKSTLFSDDRRFERTCRRIRGENETKIIRDIAQLIVPSAEILADDGEEHLEILRETTNAGWNNAIPFYGSRPQPDFSLGFKREAFTPEQLSKLQPFIGNELEDCSYIAATYNMYLPFLTSEVKCGASALDIADRQNLHSQTVALRNLIELFRLVGRETELHREINGFSISHSDTDVRIWGHYAVINKGDFTFYRHPITQFAISPTEEGDQRWKAYNFVRNIYDMWLSEHFQKIRSAIDMIPVDLNFEVSDFSEPPYQDSASSRSGLSQQFDGYDLDDATRDGQQTVQQITPDPTIHAGSSDPKKTKR